MNKSYEAIKIFLANPQSTDQLWKNNMLLKNLKYEITFQIE